MNNNQPNPEVAGIPQDIDNYLNREVHTAIVNASQAKLDSHVNPYISAQELEIVNILKRRAEFAKQRHPTFASCQEFRSYVVNAWVNQIGYPSELFPGFVKACQELGIPYYRDSN